MTGYMLREMSPTDLLVAGAVLGIMCFLLGAVVGAWLTSWCRRRRQRERDRGRRR